MTQGNVKIALSKLLANLCCLLTTTDSVHLLKHAMAPLSTYLPYTVCEIELSYSGDTKEIPIWCARK